MRVNFSTSAFPGKEKFEYWHDVVCKKFVTAESVNESQDSFDAELISQPAGRLEIGEMQAPTHSWSRGLRHIRGDGEEHYLLSLIEEGSGILQQNGRTARQKAGDISIYDTARPFDYALSARVKILKIPHKYLDARAPHAREFLAVNLSNEARLAALLASVVRTAFEMDLGEGTQAIVGERLADSIIDLLLALLDLHRETQGGHGGGYDSLEKIKAFARANLACSDLTPQSLADAGAVSTRTLNRIFGKMGTTPMRWILHERLRLSRSYLRDGYAKSVTEAAFMVGFSDLGHFSRSFKQLFGHTPEQSLSRR